MRTAEGEAKVARRPERAATSAGGWGSGRSLSRDRDVAGRPPPPAPPLPALLAAVAAGALWRLPEVRRGSRGAAAASREVKLRTGRRLVVRVVEF